MSTDTARTAAKDISNDPWAKYAPFRDQLLEKLAERGWVPQNNDDHSALDDLVIYVMDTNVHLPKPVGLHDMLAEFVTKNTPAEPPAAPAIDLLAPLPDDARFQSYYFSFEPTGIGAIDAILSAVAVAGKGSHHTQSWGDESDAYVDRPGLADGESAQDIIQQNAERSAAVVRALVTELAASKALIAEMRAAVAG
jgi:hypothetical protein